jgi:hypothetical protein
MLRRSAAFYVQSHCCALALQYMTCRVFWDNWHLVPPALRPPAFHSLCRVLCAPALLRSRPPVHDLQGLLGQLVSGPSCTQDLLRQLASGPSRASLSSLSLERCSHPQDLLGRLASGPSCTQGLLGQLASGPSCRTLSSLSLERCSHPQDLLGQLASGPSCTQDLLGQLASGPSCRAPSRITLEHCSQSGLFVAVRVGKLVGVGNPWQPYHPLTVSLSCGKIEASPVGRVSICPISFARAR